LQQRAKTRSANYGGVNMAGDMEKDQQYSGQYGQGSQQSAQTGQHGQGQKSGQPGQSGQSGQTGQQQKGNVDPNRKNPSQDDEQEENDRQLRAS